MIKPTIGRVVWFWPSDSFIEHRGRHNKNFVRGDNGPYAAMVVRVLGDHLVNLSAYDSNGNHHPVINCPLKQGDDISDTIDAGSSYCEWMPYQVGQAKKDQAEVKP